MNDCKKITEVNKNKSGIYILKNKINNNVYVGMTKNFNNRLEHHKDDLLNDKHHQFNLQREFNSLLDRVKSENVNNEFYKYIDFKTYIFEKYYTMEILEEIEKSKMKNVECIQKIEDDYILQYRKIQEGYKQKTNEEIKKNTNEKEIMESNRVQAFRTKEEERRIKEEYISNVGDYLLLNYDNTQYEISYEDIRKIFDGKDNFGCDCMYNYLYSMNHNTNDKMEIKLNIEDFKKYIEEYYSYKKTIYSSNCGANRKNILFSLKNLQLKDLKTLSKIEELDLEVDFMELDKCMLEYLKPYRVNINTKPDVTFKETLSQKIDFNKKKYETYQYLLNKINETRKATRDIIDPIINKFIIDNDIFIITQSQQKLLNDIIPLEYRCETLYRTLKAYDYNMEFIYDGFVILSNMIDYKKTRRFAILDEVVKIHAIHGNNKLKYNNLVNQILDKYKVDRDYLFKTVHVNELYLKLIQI